MCNWIGLSYVSPICRATCLLKGIEMKIIRNAFLAFILIWVIFNIEFSTSKPYIKEVGITSNNVIETSSLKDNADLIDKKAVSHGIKKAATKEEIIKDVINDYNSNVLHRDTLTDSLYAQQSYFGSQNQKCVLAIRVAYTYNFFDDEINSKKWIEIVKKDCFSSSTTTYKNRKDRENEENIMRLLTLPVPEFFSYRGITKPISCFPIEEGKSFIAQSRRELQKIECQASRKTHSAKR